MPDTPSLASPPASRSWLRAIRPIDGVLYLLIVLGCVLRVYNVIVHNPLDHIWSDPQRHWDHAREPLTPSPMALFDPPVFQLWLSVVQKITTAIPALIAAYAAALSVVTPWAWYRFLREALQSKTLALAGWAILALLPTWIGIYSYFMSETLFLPALGMSMWMTMRAKRLRTVNTFVWMTAWWTFCGLTRGIGIPLAGIAALWVWLGHPLKLRTALWSTLLIVTTLTPVAYRNYYHFKFWAPHGMSWLNKIYVESGARVIELSFTRSGANWGYGFGSPSIDSHPLAPFSDWISKRSGTVRVFIDFNNGLKDWKSSYERTAKHGSELWALHLENLIFLFFGDSWPDNNPYYAMGKAANLSRWLWAPLLLITLVAFIWRFKENIRRPLLPLLIGTWLFFQAWMLLVPNEGRYRKPFEGLIVAQILMLIDLRRSRNTASSIAINQPESSTAPAVINTSPELPA